MPTVTKIANPPEYIPLLREGKIHIVGFAEVGMSFFRSYLELAFHFPLQRAIELCDKINEADETGTIFPRGNLTGLPVRFFRQAVDELDLPKLQSCIKDAFNANRDLCKSREMVFQFSCAVMNQDLLEREITEYSLACSDDPSLEMVTLVFDSV